MTVEPSGNAQIDLKLYSQMYLFRKMLKERTELYGIFLITFAHATQTHKALVLYHSALYEFPFTFSILSNVVHSAWNSFPFWVEL